MKQLPASLMASLKNIKGFSREAFQQVHASGEQVTSIRINPVKVKSDELKVKSGEEEHSEMSNVKAETTSASKQSAIANLQSAIPWCPYGYYLSSRPSFTFDPLLHAGAYYVQEASSMFLWQVLKQTVGDNTTGLKVLDLCAAPGGKSTLLASYFQDGLVVANDVIRSRAAILVENITKWGSANTVVTNNDPKDFAALEGYFDVMIIDAPCSGSGLFRRDADAIAEWSEDNVQLCSQRQQRILADVYNALKNNGILVYSTCSYSKQEDEDILDWICTTFNLESLRLTIDDAWGIIETESDTHGAYGYRFYPDKVKGEGLFIAALRKMDGNKGEEYRMQGLQKISKEETALVADIVNKQDDLFYFKQGENIIAAPSQWKNDIAILQKHLYLRKAGITVGILKGKDIVPDHELAMSALVDKNIPRAALTKEEAIQYLQKKDIQVSNLDKGWALATYNQISLGWIKVLHNRVNNYYPVEWRILKDNAPVDNL